jgi:hypothetical protein
VGGLVKGMGPLEFLHDIATKHIKGTLGKHVWAVEDERPYDFYYKKGSSVGLFNVNVVLLNIQVNVEDESLFCWSFQDMTLDNV